MKYTEIQFSHSPLKSYQNKEFLEYHCINTIQDGLKIFITVLIFTQHNSGGLTV